jgi:hypothetical protein
VWHQNFEDLFGKEINIWELISCIHHHHPRGSTHLARIINNLFNEDSSPLTSACENFFIKVARFDDFIE